MHRRRGNPNWGKPMPPVSADIPATEFERVVKHLRLTPDMYVTSRQLRVWCLRNSNRCYIPEWLLKEWGSEVQITYGLDAA